MRLDEMACQHGGKVGSCSECDLFRAAVSKQFKKKNDEMATGVALWIADTVKTRGMQPTLEEVVKRIATMQVSISILAYAYIEGLRSIAESDTLEKAQLSVAVLSAASKILPGYVVDPAVVEALDKACLKHGLYERLSEARENEGTRGATILGEIR